MLMMLASLGVCGAGAHFRCLGVGPSQLMHMMLGSLGVSESGPVQLMLMMLGLLGFVRVGRPS